MKINFKKIIVSLLVIVGFVFYAFYQRSSLGNQSMVNTLPTSAVSAQASSDTVSSTTETTSGSLPPADSTQTLKLKGSENNRSEDNDNENEDSDDEGTSSQQTTTTTSGQTGTGSTSTTGTTSGSSNSTTSTTTAPTVTTVANALYKDGQYDGIAADAYYGLVQVKAIIQGGKLTDIQFLSYPSDRSYSVELNSQALPILKSEAIQNQSAKVNIVSGATNSSRAFIISLSSALTQAQA
ncbi:MAG: FMN-binding protein [Actinomycetota bacterium]